MGTLNHQQIIRCPNCGSKAKRLYFTSKQVIHRSCLNNEVTQTECAVCDYLMMICSLDGKVIEAEFSGTGVLSRSTQNDGLNTTTV